GERGRERARAALRADRADRRHADVAERRRDRALLARVEGVGAVVAHVADAVGARLAGRGIDVAVGLVGVEALEARARMAVAGAVVAGLAHAIAIGVELVGVRDVRAVVAGVADAVEVAVGLVGVRDPRAVVLRVGDAVAVPVVLRALVELADEDLHAQVRV